MSVHRLTSILILAALAALAGCGMEGTPVLDEEDSPEEGFIVSLPNREVPARLRDQIRAELHAQGWRIVADGLMRPGETAQVNVGAGSRYWHASIVSVHIENNWAALLPTRIDSEDVDLNAALVDLDGVLHDALGERAGPTLAPNQDESISMLGGNTLMFVDSEDPDQPGRYLIHIPHEGLPEEVVVDLRDDAGVPLGNVKIASGVGRVFLIAQSSVGGDWRGRGGDVHVFEVVLRNGEVSFDHLWTTGSNGVSDAESGCQSRVVDYRMVVDSQGRPWAFFQRPYAKHRSPERRECGTSFYEYAWDVRHPDSGEQVRVYEPGSPYENTIEYVVVVPLNEGAAIVRTRDARSERADLRPTLVISRTTMREGGGELRHVEQVYSVAYGHRARDAASAAGGLLTVTTVTQPFHGQEDEVVIHEHVVNTDGTRRPVISYDWDEFVIEGDREQLRCMQIIRPHATTTVFGDPILVAAILAGCEEDNRFFGQVFRQPPHMRTLNYIGFATKSVQSGVE